MSVVTPASYFHVRVALIWAAWTAGCLIGATSDELRLVALALWMAASWGTCFLIREGVRAAVNEPLRVGQVVLASLTVAVLAAYVVWSTVFHPNMQSDAALPSWAFVALWVFGLVGIGHTVLSIQRTASAESNATQ